MKTQVLCTLLSIVVFVAFVQADCDEDTSNGEVSGWLKNIGCKISKGASDLSDSAKPWGDKIATSAKEFGSNVAQKYDEIKHKLTDETATAASSPLVHNAPTEKVPLAPLIGDTPLPAAVPTIAVNNNPAPATAA